MKFEDVRFLTVEEAVRMQRLVINTSGGMVGVHDMGMLESAIGRPRQSFGGEVLYPSIASMAAAYMHSIVKNHPFSDGNKRCALALGLTFARRHCSVRLASNDGWEALMVGVAIGEISHGLLVAVLAEVMGGDVSVTG